MEKNLNTRYLPTRRSRTIDVLKFHQFDFTSCGVLSSSLAVATDAAHLLTDFAGFMISLFALYLGQRKPSRAMPFGWHRAEVIGALTSVLTIWLVTGILVYMAIERIIYGEYEIDAIIMLITSGLGVLVNLVMGMSLHQHSHSHGHNNNDELATKDSDVKKNINVRAAFIHVIGDLIQSVGVFIAALVIQFKPEWKIVDPICTFLFSVLVLITTFGIIKDTLIVLMEGLPRDVDFDDVMNTLLSIDGVMAVHNLRIWALSLDKTALAAHIAISNSLNNYNNMRLHYYYYNIIIIIIYRLNMLSRGKRGQMRKVLPVGENSSASIFDLYVGLHVHTLGGFHWLKRGESHLVNIQLNGRMNALEERLDRLASAAAAPSRSAGAPPPIFREKRDAAFGDGPDCACPPEKVGARHNLLALDQSQLLATDPQFKETSVNAKLVTNAWSLVETRMESFRPPRESIIQKWESALSDGMVGSSPALQSQCSPSGRWPRMYNVSILSVENGTRLSSDTFLKNSVIVPNRRNKHLRREVGTVRHPRAELECLSWPRTARTHRSRVSPTLEAVHSSTRFSRKLSIMRLPHHSLVSLLNSSATELLRPSRKDFFHLRVPGNLPADQLHQVHNSPIRQNENHFTLSTKSNLVVTIQKSGNMDSLVARATDSSCRLHAGDYKSDFLLGDESGQEVESESPIVNKQFQNCIMGYWRTSPLRQHSSLATSALYAATLTFGNVRRHSDEFPLLGRQSHAQFKSHFHSAAYGGKKEQPAIDTQTRFILAEGPWSTLVAIIASNLFLPLERKKIRRASRDLRDLQDSRRATSPEKDGTNSRRQTSLDSLTPIWSVINLNNSRGSRKTRTTMRAHVRRGI
ncbi:unnamed protein product, partial [Nesidiocoris tenuis]